jgi:phosphoribosylanthranilate isomerase
MAILTLTGIDHTVDAGWINEFGKEYEREHMVEFAILRSPKVGQSARFPTKETIRKITNYVYPEKLAFHLCGRYARMVFSGEWLELCDIIDFSLVSRVQVNSTECDEKAMMTLLKFSAYIRLPVVMQWRGETFPYVGSINILQDRSGGTGELPSEWISMGARVKKCYQAKQNFPHAKIGYAGGLNPDNIVEQMPKIIKAASSNFFWVDCESGIRTNDLFDKDKAQAMLDAVCAARGVMKKK